MDNPFILHFVTVMIFSLMLAIGINHPIQQLTFLWRQPVLMLRSLVAVVVLVPIVVFVLLRLLDLPLAVATGLAILAAAPGAPMTYKRTQMAAGDPIYAASLQLTLAMLAVIITPLTLAIFYLLLELATERVTPTAVAGQVAQVTIMPVIIGLLFRHFAPGLAERINKPLRVFANVLFILFVVLLIVMIAIKPDLRAMLNIGGLPITAIVIMVVVALAFGHLLGGPSQDFRSVLAVACIARNAGLAFYIAGLSAYGQQFTPTLLTYVVLGSALAIPYSVWSKRRTKGSRKKILHSKP